MATPTTVAAPSFGALKKAVLIVVGVVALYFVYHYVLHYFVWSENSYGYYWKYRLPLIAHASGGLLALLMGVFQLWSGLNRRRGDLVIVTVYAATDSSNSYRSVMSRHGSMFQNESAQFYGACDDTLTNQ